MSTPVTVKPELLRWAVERSGLPSDRYHSSIDAWLKGDKKPTFPQLEAFARKARVPFGYLFLETPPKETLPVPDYRTRTDRQVRRPSPDLIETIFEMQARQDWMRDYLLEEGQSELPFVGSARVGDSIGPLAKRMRLSLGLGEDWARELPSKDKSLKYLREKIEEAGILIFINGVVGNSTRRKLNPEEFQGFVLIDKIAPLIFVNGADFKSAQMFTIAHELAHVWVGKSALFDLVAMSPSSVKIEKYCNQLAAEFLVPAKVLQLHWIGDSSGETTFVSLGRRFKVSPIVVARRALDLKLITSEIFFTFYQAYASRELQKQREKPDGGDFWRNQPYRLGRRFGRAVVAAAQEGRLSYSSAYSLTRLHGDTFDKYAHSLEAKSEE